MTTAQTVCLLCFILLLGTAHAQDKTLTTTKAKETEKKQTSSIDTTDKTNGMTNENSINGTTNETLNQGSSTSALTCVCPTPPNCTSTPKSTPTPINNTPKAPLGHCILFLPNEKTWILVLVVLAVSCITLLLTTLLCTCHVCHQRAIISRFQPYPHSVDLHSVRKRSESPCRDDGQEKGPPTETCLLLSEVSKQEEENKEEIVQPNFEPPAEKPNGDITQEEENAYSIVSEEPAVGIPEVSATGIPEVSATGV